MSRFPFASSAPRQARPFMSDAQYRRWLREWIARAERSSRLLTPEWEADLKLKRLQLALLETDDPTLVQELAQQIAAAVQEQLTGKPS